MPSSTCRATSTIRERVVIAVFWMKPNAKGHGDQQRRRYIPDLALEDGRILVAQEAKKSEKIGLPPGIDDMVSASQQMIHILRVGARCRVLPEHRKVGRHLPVEQGQLLQLCARELSQPALVGLGQQRGQPVPVRPALENPLVGKD